MQFSYKITTVLRMGLRTASIIGFMCLMAATVRAGLLEMPEITDKRTLKGKSVYENFDIPNVRERNPDPAAGPRIWVREFRLQGVIDRPEYGLRKEAVEQYAEKLRYEAMLEEELLKYGYTLEDLSEIANLMLEIDAAGQIEQVSEPDVQKLIWLVKEQKERRGLTTGKMEEVAGKLENYYREHGFFLAKVFLSTQQIRDGIVGFTVLEGKLGKITITGNQRYQTNFISGTFDEVLYQPVTAREFEQKLYLLNNYPGLNVYGSFKDGDQVGDSHLYLKVRRETPSSAMLRLDNYGSELTGQERFFAQGQWFNVSANADELTVGILRSTNPSNSTYGGVKYKIPLFTEAFQARLNYSRNQFALGEGNATEIGSLGIVGDTTIRELKLEYALTRRRENNWFIYLNYADKKSDLKSYFADLDDRVKTVSLGTSYDTLDMKSKTLNQASLTITSGRITEGALLEQDPDFLKYTFNYSYLTFVQIPWTDISTRIIIKTGIQYAGALLPPVEQYSLAGPNTVRAYSVTQFSADNAAYIGADWILNWPAILDFNVSDNVKFSQLVQPFLFVDYGYAELFAVGTAEDATAELSGYGFGLQLNYRNSISVNLQFAQPIAHHLSGNANETVDDDLRVLFDFQYIL